MVDVFKLLDAIRLIAKNRVYRGENIQNFDGEFAYILVNAALIPQEYAVHFDELPPGKISYFRQRTIEKNTGLNMLVILIIFI